MRSSSIFVVFVLLISLLGIGLNGQNETADIENRLNLQLNSIPSSPYNLSAEVYVNATDSYIELYWDYSYTEGGNITFNVYRSGYEDVPMWNSSYIIGNTHSSEYWPNEHYHDDDVEIGNTYYYRVSAENYEGESDMSEVFSVTVEGENDEDQEGPSTTGLSMVWIIILFLFVIVIGGGGIVWKRKSSGSNSSANSNYQQHNQQGYVRQNLQHEQNLTQDKNQYQKTDDQVAPSEKKPGKSIAERKSDIESKIDSLKDEEKLIDTREVEEYIKKNDIDKAENLMENLRDNYQEYKKTIKELTSLDRRKSSLAEQLADEKIDRQTFNDARKAMEHRKAELEEKLERLRREVIYEDYQKPF